MPGILRTSLRRILFPTLLVLVGGMLLSGCRFPTELFFSPDTPPPNQVDPPAPTVTLAITATAVPVLPPTDTPPPCAYAQAEQDLPEVTARVQDKLNEAGLGSVEALAVAFGENCVDTINNKILSFGAIETDFYFTLVVADTEDKETLGKLSRQLLGVVEQFPPGETPGPNLGYLTIVFQDGKKDARLRARLVDAKQAKDEGLTGADFYARLGGT
jgi:hypothetical protein